MSPNRPPNRSPNRAPETPAETAKATAMESSPLLGNESAAALSQRHAKPETPATPQISELDSRGEGEEEEGMEFKGLSRKSQWIALAVMSGACAASNGVFAKLTTTELTTTFATWIAYIFGLGNGEKVVEVIVRIIFFALNLVFNAIMWALFTKALARGTSTTQVSIINTSSNFMITAVLGWLIFSESLPPLWFLGAAFLVAGNVIIGRREEKDTLRRDDNGEGVERGEGRRSGESEGLLDGEETGLQKEDLEELERKRREREEADILDLGDDEESGSEDLMDLRP